MVFLSAVAAAAADYEKRDDDDPDPVVVEEAAKTACVASTVRVHKKILSDVTVRILSRISLFSLS